MAIGAAPAEASADVVGSPEWWLPRLHRKLDARHPQVVLYDDYYAGKHRMAFSTSTFRKAFGSLFREFADDWCALVVDAVEERLSVEGFRFTEQNADTEAWRIWQANQLDADSQIAHTEALVQGQAYVMVWEGEKDTPVITVESPAQVTVAYEAGSRRKRAAALKRWLDDDEHMLCTLYLPDGIYKYRSSSKQPEVTLMVMDGAEKVQWDKREPKGETWPLRNPHGVVPIVPLVNRPRLRGEGESEIRRVIPVQDAVNKLVADMLLASEFGAFRQRWITGIEIPTDENNRPIESFKAAIDRVWAITSSEAKLGEFDVTDLSNYVEAVEMLVQHIASQTRTPPHYFYLRGEFPSGESIKAAEAGLTAKAKQKHRHFGESWEEVMRLAFLVLGDKERANVVGAETLWKDPESRTESQHIDAVLKKKDLNVPERQLWEDAGYSQAQIERFKEMRKEEGEEVPPADKQPPVE